MRVLLELRPAFDGHSGIPQETRLLFRSLALMPGVEAVGLLQSNNLVVDPGLPVRHGQVMSGISADERVDRLSQVVVSLQQGAASHRFEYVRRKFLKFFGTAFATCASLLGRRVPIGAFEPRGFEDFLWRSMFEKSLPAADFVSVTGASYRVLRWPWAMLHALGVATSWLGKAIYPRLNTDGVDVVIAETPFPCRVASATRLVVRYHDAIPLLMPHTIKQRGYHRTAHFEALRRNARDGAWFACVSESTRRDLLSVLPELADRSVTIPNMVSHHFYEEDAAASRVPEVIWSRRNRSAPAGGGAEPRSSDLVEGRLKFLLIVCTIEPRKNHLTLIDAWERLRAQSPQSLHLVVVGSLGWDHHAILARLTPWLERGGIHMLCEVPSDDLRLLYRHAEATVCPSFGEGFDFPGIEAMRCGGVVVASDIPVHRDVFGEGCEYFSPYSADALVAALSAVTGPAADRRRDALIETGREVAKRYLPEVVTPVWSAFLTRVAESGNAKRSAQTGR